MFRVLCLGLALFSFQLTTAQTVQQLLAKKVLLPNGWGLTPVGRNLQLGDLPLNMVLSKSQQLMAITNNGQGTQSIQLIDPVTEKILDTKIIDRSWYGLAFSNDRSEEHTSELQSHHDLVCRLLLEKK